MININDNNKNKENSPTIAHKTPRLSRHLLTHTSNQRTPRTFD
jgi:hypothetical protein